MPRAATSKVDASRTRIATSGSANWATWVPNRLIVSPDHSFRKSAVAPEAAVGQRLRIDAPRRQSRLRAEQRERESVALAARIVGGLVVGDEPVQALLEASPVGLR